jgi:hypothetical protein
MSHDSLVLHVRQCSTCTHAGAASGRGTRLDVREGAPSRQELQQPRALQREVRGVTAGEGVEGERKKRVRVVEERIGTGSYERLKAPATPTAYAAARQGHARSTLYP